MTNNFGSFKRDGFAFIELMLVLLIISSLLIFAVEEYKRHIAETRITRARADMEELAKAVRLYNIKEPKFFDARTFSPSALGAFIGTYLEKEPPRDPWGNFYFHSDGMGVIFSCGPDGKPQATLLATDSDDIVVSYLPYGFFITRAEYVDANVNNLVDFDDHVIVSFSRPAKLFEPVVMDFETSSPEKALGSALVRPGENAFQTKIFFEPPFAPEVVPGETKLYIREFNDSIRDLSPEPQRLQRQDGVIIEKRRN